MITRVEARRAARKWKQADPVPYPVAGIFARLNGYAGEDGRRVDLGYFAHDGSFWKVVRLFVFPDGTVTVEQDRRRDASTTKWPAGAVA